MFYIRFAIDLKDVKGLNRRMLNVALPYLPKVDDVLYFHDAEEALRGKPFKVIVVDAVVQGGIIANGRKNAFDFPEGRIEASVVVNEM